MTTLSHTAFSPSSAIATPLVLCVDDNPRTLEILTKILSTLPVRCLTAQQPQEAIDLAAVWKPRLLILDLMMPRMSGWEVLDKIRALYQGEELHVLILTAKDDHTERVMAANVAHVDLFLSKPFDTDELASAVLRLLNLPARRENTP